MRLKHITFTGIDAHTDILELQAIQQQYPIAEFGVLTSYHWYENGNRYLDPRLIRSLRGIDHLSLHICGQAASDAALGQWDEINYLTYNGLSFFNRFQLNISNRNDKPYCAYRALPIYGGGEVIIQTRNADYADLFHRTEKMWGNLGQFSMLLDASGGKGVDCPINIYPYSGKIGYAGGINPDNVADKLTFLFEHVNKGEFWIDMESGVRTDDWFDLGKVEQVLETCQPIIRKYGNNV